MLIDMIRDHDPAEHEQSTGPLWPNQHLLNRADARARLNTPALIVDLDALDRNIRALADYARSAGVNVRPHMKCHKSLEIARRQMESGAVGACCATISEAEVLARGGIRNILITSPLTTAEKIVRACRLTRQVERLAVVTDHPANLEQLAEAARAQGCLLRVLVDIDPGTHRTGVATDAACVSLALDCMARDELIFEGVQFYAGAGQHIESLTARREYAFAMMDKLQAVCEKLREAGCAPVVVSGSGTGSFDIDAQARVLTELQPGSYVFMDNQYCRLEYAEARPSFERALFVQAAVISANHPGMVTVDAGLKQFAVDGGSPVVTRGAPLGAVFTYMGDEHGRLTVGEGQPMPPLGGKIEFGVPHCDPTVNLYNRFHCFRGEKLVDIWPVDARGS
ncbi:MAG TPA: DSD1 family PLP-dependent enzyme [Steroidobacter sp.]|nr:DSD1 family PLP-dependent enzyme [Steroidobacter sp.]